MACNSKCACNCKSTIDANFVASQTLAINDVFNFPNVTKTGISVISNGSGSFTLNNPGLYLSTRKNTKRLLAKNGFYPAAILFGNNTIA